MVRHGYVTKLYETALKLGMNILSYEFLGINSNDLNPTGIMVIKKDNGNKDYSKSEDNVFECPITRTELKKYENEYYSSDAMLLYPIVGGIPCLISNSALVATKFLEFYDEKVLN